MIFKHSGFDGSEVMREMERLEAKKNPDAVWKPAPIAKKASSFKSNDPFHNMIMLVAKLRDAGRVEEANRLMTKMAAYQKTASDVHLYRAIDEDGEDLLEFAYPDGDVDVAPAEGEHGKVHTPQNAHKRIVDIVQKTPTGKYASPTETLLKSVAGDLGLKKTAKVNLFNESVLSIKEVMPEPSAGPKFYLDYSGNYWFIRMSFGLMTKEDVFGMDMLTNKNKPRGTNKGKKWGLFLKALRNPDFEKEVNSGAFSRTRLWNYIGSQVKKANEGLDAIYQIPWGVIEKLEQIDVQNNPGEVDRLLSRLENNNDCLWIVGLMALGTMNLSKENFLSAVSVARSHAQPYIDNHNKEQTTKRRELAAIKSRMLAARAKYIQAANSVPTGTQGADAFKKYCSDIATAILTHQTDPIKAGQLASKLNNNAKFLEQAANINEAIAKFEADSIQTLRRVNASSKKNINKIAQAPPIGTTKQPAAKKPAAKKPAGAGGRPVSSYDKWLDSVRKWQTDQRRIGSRWYESVQALQALLVNFGDTAVLNKIKAALTQKDPKRGKAFQVEDVQSAIRNTGWANYSGSYREDGKWGPATSKSILEVKKILEMFDDTTSELDVPRNGVLGTASDTKEEKDAWGLKAQKIRNKILDFTTKHRITGLGGGAAAGTTASKDTVFDRLPQKPIHVSGYNEKETGPVELMGSHLATLKDFHNWLIGNRLVPIDATGSFKMKVREWLLTVFDNLKKRARYLQKVAITEKNKAKETIATQYLNAVMTLEQQFQDAVAKWIPKELEKQKKKSGQDKWTVANVATSIAVSLLELFNAAGGAPTTGTGAGAGARAGAGAGAGGASAGGATGTEGTAGPQVITDTQKQEHFPIGYDIYPPSWQKYGYDAGTQIFSNNVAGQPISKYVSFRINVNDVRSAYDIDTAMAVMMQPGPEVSMQKKLQILGRIGSKTPAGTNLANLDPSSPRGQIIQAKFNAYLLSRIAGALAMDVIRVAQSYGLKQWAQDHKDWADAVHQNAIVWVRHLKRVERMAQRAYGSDSASGQVSRFFA